MSGKNAYESGKQKVIPAVLLYAFFDNKVLMIHRNQKENDFHVGKWNGLGGKVDLGETTLDCTVREFEEESGCKTLPSQWKWAGQLSFPNFKPHKNEDWNVTVYRTELTPLQLQKILPTNAEGTLHWIPSTEVLALNLWEGDQKFLPFLLKKQPFQGTFFYADGKLSRFFCDSILE